MMLSRVRQGKGRGQTAAFGLCGEVKEAKRGQCRTHLWMNSHQGLHITIAQELKPSNAETNLIKNSRGETLAAEAC